MSHCQGATANKSNVGGYERRTHTTRVHFIKLDPVHFSFEMVIPAKDVITTNNVLQWEVLKNFHLLPAVPLNVFGPLTTR